MEVKLKLVLTVRRYNSRTTGRWVMLFFWLIQWKRSVLTIITVLLPFVSQAYSDKTWNRATFKYSIREDNLFVPYRDVQKLLGLLLLAIDPEDTLVDGVYPTLEAKFFIGRWRREAQSFLNSNPQPNDRRGLPGFISQWQAVAYGKEERGFPRDWPVLELVFKLISWIPEFQGEPEHQVWLEAITRVIASTGMESPYGMQLLQNTAGQSQGVHIET